MDSPVIDIDHEDLEGEEIFEESVFAPFGRFFDDEQVSKAQMEKILGYIDIGREEGATCLTGGSRNALGEGLDEGYYITPTLLLGDNNMRVFQEEIFGPVASVTTFKDEDEAIDIANATYFGLGAGVWSRDGSRAYRVGRGVEAGRVWTNSHVSCPCRLRRIQTVGYRPRNAQDGSRQLPTDQMPARQL